MTDFRAAGLTARGAGLAVWATEPPPALVVHLDGLAPCFALAGVDLAQVQHLTLHHTTVTHTPVLHHVPVALGLAILDPSGAAQKHAPTPQTAHTHGNRQSLHYKRLTKPPLHESITRVRKMGRFPEKQRRVERDGGAHRAGPKGWACKGAHALLHMLAGGTTRLRCAPGLRPLADPTRTRPTARQASRSASAASGGRSNRARATPSGRSGSAPATSG